MKTTFEPRTKEVELGALSEYFEKIEVRGLTGEELARVNESVERNEKLGLVAQALGGSNEEQINAFKRLMGFMEEHPDDFIKRVETLKIGCVVPEFDQQMTLKLAKNFPQEFMLITNTIYGLMKQGSAAVEKPKPSGETAK